MYINPIPVLVLRAILPLPFPMHKQCRQIMDRFLAVDRSFVIVPPLTKKRRKEKRGENHNAISAVRKSIFERLEHMYTLCYYLYRKQFDYEPRKNDPSFLFVEKFSWSSKWSWSSSVIGWLQGRRKVCKCKTRHFPRNQDVTVKLKSELIFIF